MNLELLDYINLDMKWTVMRKGRTSMTRCPRKPAAFERKKSGTDVVGKVFDVPLKKQRVLHQSTSPPLQCINGEESQSPGSQTPSVHEDSGQQGWSTSLSKGQKKKPKARLRQDQILKPANKEVQELVDFSGIDLLADVACGSFIHDNADHVEDFSISKEHTTPPGFNSCPVDVKGAESNGSSIQPNLQDGGKELRLHWDLNTVMDEWEEPCDDLLIKPRLPVEHDATIAPVSPVGNCNDGSVKETHALTEDLEVMSTKKIDVKTSDGESYENRSDVVDPLTHSGKCADFLNSSASVLVEQTVVNSEEVMQDHVSECCGSNVTQEEQAGYDSPFEDGELRELNEKTESEAVYEFDKTYKDDLGPIENPLLEKVDHGQTRGDQTSLLVKDPVLKDEIKQQVQVDTFERPHFDESRKDGHDGGLSPVGGNLLQIDESTCFDVSRNGEYVRNRSGTNGDYSMRAWDLKSHRSLDSNYIRNYNSTDGSYRTHDRRSSSSERINGYRGSRGPPPARSHSYQRYRFQSQEYHDPKPFNFERKPRFSPNFNQHCTRSIPRSRSGSPIAWHFQKRKNLDSSNSGEIETETRGGHVSPQRSSKCFDGRRFRDGRSSVTIKQRFDLTGYPERLKSDDYFRFTQRPARFSNTTSYKYKDRQ